MEQPKPGTIEVPGIFFYSHLTYGFTYNTISLLHIEHKLSEYKGSKGAVQFPIEKPLPLELISEIVKFRVAENIEEVGSKLKDRKKVASDCL